jgi:hypothetical protein
MYTAIFSLGAALIACAGLLTFEASTAMAAGFFVAAMAVGAGLDIMRARQRPVCG